MDKIADWHRRKGCGQLQHNGILKTAECDIQKAAEVCGNYLKITRIDKGSLLLLQTS